MDIYWKIKLKVYECECNDKEICSEHFLKNWQIPNNKWGWITSYIFPQIKNAKLTISF